MADFAIKVENLSKCYRIGERQPYKTIRESLVKAFKAPFHRSTVVDHPSSVVNLPSSVAGHRSSVVDILWALKDISFEIKQGEVIGIIGRNGAGKSTLLKIFSKITEPTSGRIELRGRVGSLLEIGTGFHPELTGHENIYLYGAILGMHRREINRKFDEIVAFAELEKFMDTPVKRYSSGMYMRLAFAVAAHLEPDILLVDEVLAVGDTAFQKKCIGKMEHVSREGRTVLFVSHNMGAISRLCRRTLLIDSGSLKGDDQTDRVITAYLHEMTCADSFLTRDWQREGSKKVFVTAIQLFGDQGKPEQTFMMGKDLKLVVSGRSESPGFKFNFAVQVLSSLSTPLLFLYDQYITFQTDPNNDFKIEVILPEIRLMPGQYLLNVWLGREGMEEYDYVKYAAAFDIVQSAAAQTTHPLGENYGFIAERFLVKQIR